MNNYPIRSLLLASFLTAGPIFAQNLYVSNGGIGGSGANNVSVVNLSNFSFTTPINGLPDNPFGVALSPDGKFLYVASNGTNQISKVDLSNNTSATIATILPLPPTRDAWGLAISPDGNTLYVSTDTDDQVAAVNLSTFVVTTPISLGMNNNPLGLAISPDGTTLYTANNNSDTISIVNLSTFSVNTIPTMAPFFPGDPWGLAITSDGKSLYVGNNGSASISVLDISSLTFTTPIAGLPFEPNGLALSSDGKLLYVADNLSGNVSVVDLSTFAVTTPITGLPLAGGPFFLVLGLATLPSFISTAGLCGNNLSLANYLNESAPASVVQLFAILQDGALNRALGSAAPTRNALVTYTSQLTQQALGQLVADHLTQERCPGRPRQSDGPYTVWLSAFGEYTREKFHANDCPQDKGRFEATSGGFVAAFDYNGSDPGRTGGGIGYAHVDMEAHEHGGDHGSVDQGYIFGYGTFPFTHGYFDLGLWGGYYSVHNNRHISFDGFSAHARLKTHGWQVIPHVELGLNWLGDSEDWCIEPFTSVDWVNTWEDDAREHGASFLNMGQKSRFCSLFKSETGLRFQETATYDWGVITFREKASYVYQRAVHTGTINAYLVGSPDSFKVKALSGIQNLGVGEFAILFSPNNDYFYLSLTYQGQFGSNYVSHQGILEIGKDF